MHRLSRTMLWILLGANILANTHPNCSKSAGQIHCKLLKTDRFRASGIVNLIDAEILSNCQIKGILQAKNLKTKNLMVSGQVYLAHSHIEQQFTLEGTALITSSAINGKFKASSDKIIASDAQFNTIEISSHHQTPTLQLRNNSKVSGDVVFKGMPGHIITDSPDKIAGKIINGQYIKP